MVFTTWRNTSSRCSMHSRTKVPSSREVSLTRDDFYRRYTVTICYLESLNIGCCHGPRRRCEWTFVDEEISEDDATWTALREFRRDVVHTWAGWPRHVFTVSVTPEAPRYLLQRHHRHELRHLLPDESNGAQAPVEESSAEQASAFAAL